MRGQWLGLAVLVASAFGCRPDGPSQGELKLSWDGPETGQLRMPASALLCVPGGWLEVVATKGDTGVALVAYPSDSLLVGSYAVRDPADSLTEGARVAVRWFGEAAVFGLQSRAGSLVVADESRQTIGGRFDASMVAVMRPDTFAVSGTFRRVPVVPGDSGCARPAPRTAPDTSID